MRRMGRGLHASVFLSGIGRRTSASSRATHFSANRTRQLHGIFITTAAAAAVAALNPTGSCLHTRTHGHILLVVFFLVLVLLLLVLLLLAMLLILVLLLLVLLLVLLLIPVLVLRLV
jgi:hypothetical protein